VIPLLLALTLQAIPQNEKDTSKEFTIDLVRGGKKETVTVTPGQPKG